MVKYFNNKVSRVGKTAIIAMIYFILNSNIYSTAIKGWIEFKGGMQFIDTTITQLTDTIYVDPHIVVNHDIYPLEIDYTVLSDNGVAAVAGAGYSTVKGEDDKYFFGGTLDSVYKVDFSRLLFTLGGRKYFGIPGKANNTCFYFGADLGLSMTTDAYINVKQYSLAGDLIGSGYYKYETLDVMIRASIGAEYWISKYIGMAVCGGYILSQPHISGTPYALSDRDFSGIYIEASFLYDFMAHFDKKK